MACDIERVHRLRRSLFLFVVASMACELRAPLTPSTRPLVYGILDYTRGVYVLRARSAGGVEPRVAPQQPPAVRRGAPWADPVRSQCFVEQCPRLVAPLGPVQCDATAGDLCGNQPVCRVHREFFTKSFLGDEAAVLARSSGEEPASPCHRAGVASMAWRTTR